MSELSDVAARQAPKPPAGIVVARLRDSAGAPYGQLVEERVLRPLGVEQVWAEDGPPVTQPHDRRGRPVAPWTFGASAPAACLRGTARGAGALDRLLHPPAAPRAAAGGSSRWGSSGHSSGMWWHNGGTRGSRSFTGFVPETGAAVAAVADSARSLDGVASVLRPSRGRPRR